MNINDWSNKEIIRFITARKRISQKKLAEELSNFRHKRIAESSFASKIMRNGLKLEEVQQICELLGYNLVLEEKSEK